MVVSLELILREIEDTNADWKTTKAWGLEEFDKFKTSRDKRMKTRNDIIEAMEKELEEIKEITAVKLNKNYYLAIQKQESEDE